MVDKHVPRDRWYDLYAPSELQLQAEYEAKLERARAAAERRQREKDERETRRGSTDPGSPSSLLRVRDRGGREERGREERGSAKAWSPRAAGRTMGRHELGQTPKNFLEILEEIKASHPDIELVENQPGSEPEEIEDIIENVEEDLEGATPDQQTWFQDQTYVWDYLPEGRVAVYFIHERDMDLTHFSPEAVEAA